MILVTAAPVQICTEQFPSTPAWFWKLRNQNQSQKSKRNSNHLYYEKGTYRMLL